MIKLKSTGHKHSEDFNVEYKKPLSIKKLALQSFSMEVSWYTISEKYENNKFTIINNDIVEETITIPDGNYTVSGLNEYLMKLFKDPPVKFGIVEARQRIAIKLSKDWKINLEDGKFHKLIGFENEKYGEETEIEGKYIANISNDTDNIYIHCDAVNGSLINQNNSNVIYSFTNKNPPGSTISKEFNNLIYYPVKSNDGYIDSIRMRVTNQKGDLLDLNNGYVEYNFIPVYEENYDKKIYQLLLDKYFLLNK